MKRVFMLSNHPLLGQGVESLLRWETGLEIVGREVDVDKAIDRIRELRPDAVILDCAEPRGEPAPAVMRILQEGLGIKVVELNLQDNTMCIYRGEQRVVKSSTDLIEAIAHNALPCGPVISTDLAAVEGNGDGQREELMDAPSSGKPAWAKD
jgi:DNA-binding NarL/FixJ family response regulator